MSKWEKLSDTTYSGKVDGAGVLVYYSDELKSWCWEIPTWENSKKSGYSSAEKAKQAVVRVAKTFSKECREFLDFVNELKDQGIIIPVREKK
jgi:hypothetical protein